MCVEIDGWIVKVVFIWCSSRGYDISFALCSMYMYGMVVVNHKVYIHHLVMIAVLMSLGYVVGTAEVQSKAEDGPSACFKVKSSDY